uniref:Uncharacterized protein n=1 Tax=Bursaphelenchus xylophilus TaxID=6326 RepID=A0A1I7RQC6_BURXY
MSVCAKQMCTLHCRKYLTNKMPSEMQSFYEELSPLVKHIVIGYADHESNMQIQKLSSALMRNRLDHFNFNYTVSPLTSLR